MRRMPVSCRTSRSWCLTKHMSWKTWRAAISAFRVSTLRFEELARDVEAVTAAQQELPATLSSGSSALRERSGFFFALIPPGEGRFAFENRREFLEENGEEFIGLMQSLTMAWREIENLPSEAGRSLQLCPADAGIESSAWRS